MNNTTHNRHPPDDGVMSIEEVLHHSRGQLANAQADLEYTGDQQSTRRYMQWLESIQLYLLELKRRRLQHEELQRFISKN